MKQDSAPATTRARALAAIDDCTPKEIADGLRIAIIAFRIKAERATGRDKQWMRDRAAFMAAGILAVNTGGMTL